MTTSNISKIKLTCDHCGTQFFRKQWELNAAAKRTTTKYYCSRQCSLDAKIKNKKTKRTDWRKQIGANKEYCSSCGEQALTIIDTQKNKLGHRYRRKECRNCGERFTTYEVPSEYYNSLSETKAPLNVCFSCSHNNNSSCGLGIPEYKTPHSADCLYAETE